MWSRNLATPSLNLAHRITTQESHIGLRQAVEGRVPPPESAFGVLECRVAGVSGNLATSGSTMTILEFPHAVFTEINSQSGNLDLQEMALAPFLSRKGGGRVSRPIS